MYQNIRYHFNSIYILSTVYFLFYIFFSWILIRSAPKGIKEIPPLFDYLYFIYYPSPYAKSTFFDIKTLLSISNKKAKTAFLFSIQGFAVPAQSHLSLLTTNPHIPLHMLTITIVLTYPSASNARSKESKCLPTMNIRTD